MNVVIVESPAKAKTINKYLGGGYTVLASFGHIRDLPPKDGSVRPDEDFAMDWATDARSEKHIREIVQAVKGAKRLFLATDPDREGEAISWHVLEELNRRKALKDVEVKRVTFNAITKSAISEAMAHPRDLYFDLVHAYLARRALDYLVGFTLSPVLWRKLPGSRSAGRVQSVALRLICERESEIERFTSEEYWTVAADALSAGGKPFLSRLTHLDGTKLDKFGLPDATTAERARQAIEAGAFTVGTIERKQAKRHPFPPFTTSTLQQEAARKLYFSATKTMTLAQRLYEGVPVNGETVGLITYMRTDAVSMAPEAVNDVRTLIGQNWGDKFVPSAPRVYKTKQKNAQEAHEAIRPTNVFLKPGDVRDVLDADQFKLYELIWKRTVASQMESAVMDQMAVDLADGGKKTVLRATGSAVLFEGFLKLYTETVDDAADDDENSRLLPPLKEGEAVQITKITPEQHFTQPPPRYSEASLVKRMEELGIGRPSTYASILQVLQDRDYVRLDSRRFVPEDRGRIVTAFLESFFRRYVEYTFTADLENQLDEISAGHLDWKEVLRRFWQEFIAAVEGTQTLRISEVLDALDADLGPHLFAAPADAPEGHDPRQCPACAAGRLSLKLGKTGAFIGCSAYPECRYTRPLGGGADDTATDRVLGDDPETGLPVSVRKGPYGWYCQLGEATGEGKAKTKPKRAGLPKGMDPTAVELEQALSLLSLPRTVGLHPESGLPILAGIGRFGPYIVHDGKYVNLRDDSVLEIGINRAVDLLATANSRARKAEGKDLGAHPADQQPVKLLSGRYGPYVEHGGVRANLPRDTDPETVTLEQATEWLAAKAAKDAAAGKKPAAKKAPAKKAAAAKTEKATAEKKPAAKKAAPKKSAAKKAASDDGVAVAPPVDDSLPWDDDAPAAPAKKPAAKKAAATKTSAAKTSAAKKPATKKAPAKKAAAKTEDGGA